MEANSSPIHARTLYTVMEVQRALVEARRYIALDDITGAEAYLQPVNRFMEEERSNALTTDSALNQLRNLWLASLFSLLPLLEQQGAYQQALAYARILQRADPAHTADLRRLIHLYVLSGSRSPVMTVLQQRLAMAVHGQGALVLIHGVAGIGKTSVAQPCTIWAQQQGALAVTGRCYELGVTTPFAPWPEILTALAESTTLTLDNLPAPFGNGPPAQSPDSLIQAVATRLHQAAHATPLLLLLDDLHWADQESLLLLEFVTRRLERLPLLVLGAYRSDEVAENHPLAATVAALQRDRPSQVIRLSQFTRDDTVRFVESHLGQCEHELVDYLYERAEGHPLFLVELLDDLTEQNLLRRSAGGRWAPPDRNIPVPTLLRQIILQRVTRLGEQSKTLLDLAAVVGEVWPLAVVEAVLDWAEDDLLAVLERLLAARLIEPVDDRGERYRFSHGLIQEVLYGSQLPRRRRRL
ncbi:MAG: AAA family ATPase, partial [Caldilineaceae bacterium]|nr:AAA family ATPase [Caldilineaceae bacterium]